MPRGRKKNMYRKAGRAQDGHLCPGGAAQGAEAAGKGALRQKKEEELRQIVEIMEERNMTPGELVEILNSPLQDER